MSASVQRRARPGAPTVLNGLVSTATLLVVAILAVHVSSAPPPTIAELQPQVKQQILEAPDAQAARNGPGQPGTSGAGPNASASASPSPGAAAAGGASPAPSASASASPEIQVPRLLRCTGNPAIQTPDPQSPPCSNYYDPNAGNGGATSQGVTASTIYVAWPNLGGFVEHQGNGTSDVELLAQYFSNHFQMYGRKIKILPYDRNAFSTPSVAEMQKDATTVAKHLNPGVGVFASLSYQDVNGAEHYYYDELGKQHYKILSVNSIESATTEASLEAQAPYEWTTVPGLDYAEQNLGSMICGTLNQKAPAYVGPPPLGKTWPSKRVFGMTYSREPDGTYPDRGPLLNAMGACQAPVNYNKEVNANSAEVANGLRDAGVTSVLCTCAGVVLASIMQAAAQQQYFPEWIVQSYGFQDKDSTAYNGAGNPSTYPASQENRQIIGMTYENRFTAPETQFWYLALREVNPGYAYGDNVGDIYDYYRYEELMVLASGIQLAGPNLTPQTFQEGLQRARFPNPGHGQAPYYQAAVGFGPGKHSYFSDAAPIWYTPQDQNYTTAEPRTGSFCYIDRGLRFAAGQWPAALNFFQEPCR
ncbi:MAG: hypothetical protein NVSMB17_04230 [Candidatus Dormibacteria bacterium]